MFDDITKKINQKDLIKLQKKEIDELYEDILFEWVAENNSYNISEWYAIDLNNYYKKEEVDQDYPYAVLMRNDWVIEEWGDYLTKEYVDKIKIKN